MIKIIFICVLVFNANQILNGSPLPKLGHSLMNGDMILNKFERSAGYGVKWENGLVPYVISTQFSSTQRSLIVNSLNRISSLIGSNNCIRFVQKTSSHTDWLEFRDGGEQNGCSSMVGWIGGQQYVNLERSSCMQDFIIMHEVMHALGFLHEQNRFDRDNYVTINYSNIAQGIDHGNWNKITISKSYNTPYDFTSIMHYEATAGSASGSPVIVPKNSNNRINPSKTLTQYDIQAVRNRYCSSTNPNPVTSSPSTAAPVTCTEESFCQYNLDFLTKDGGCQMFVGDLCQRTCGKC